MNEDYNDSLYTQEDLYRDQDHRSHVDDFYNHVAAECGYASTEWIERCCYQ